jgi:hypothetical protein
MKGIIFTSIVEIVEANHGLAAVDAMLSQVSLESGGAYTAVGNYADAEAVALVTALASQLDKSVPELLRYLGKALFEKLMSWHPQIGADIHNSLDFLEVVSDHIHKEVHKLYSDARTPGLDVRREGDTVTIIYRSDRGLADLAHGLIEGCGAYYGDTLRITKKDLDGATGQHAQFVVVR